MEQSKNTSANQQGSTTVAAPMKNIVDTAIAAGNFTTLVAGIKAAGLTDTLKGRGPFTVFAPTDEAFKKLPVGAWDALLKDTAKLKSILNYHVITRSRAAAGLKSGRRDDRSGKSSDGRGVGFERAGERCACETA